jgi:hypothetical protein
MNRELQSLALTTSQPRAADASPPGEALSWEHALRRITQCIACECFASRCSWHLSSNYCAVACGQPLIGENSITQQDRTMLVMNSDQPLQGSSARVPQPVDMFLPSGRAARPKLRYKLWHLEATVDSSPCNESTASREASTSFTKCRFHCSIRSGKRAAIALNALNPAKNASSRPAQATRDGGISHDALPACAGQRYVATSATEPARDLPRPCARKHADHRRRAW